MTRNCEFSFFFHEKKVAISLSMRGAFFNFFYRKFFHVSIFKEFYVYLHRN